MEIDVGTFFKGLCVYVCVRYVTCYYCRTVIHFANSSVSAWLIVGCRHWHIQQVFIYTMCCTHAYKVNTHISLQSVSERHVRTWTLGTWCIYMYIWGVNRRYCLRPWWWWARKMMCKVLEFRWSEAKSKKLLSYLLQPHFHVSVAFMFTYMREHEHEWKAVCHMETRGVKH